MPEWCSACSQKAARGSILISYFAILVLYRKRIFVYTVFRLCTIKQRDAAPKSSLCRNQKGSSFARVVHRLCAINQSTQTHIYGSRGDPVWSPVILYRSVLLFVTFVVYVIFNPLDPFNQHPRNIENCGINTYNI